MFLYFLQSMAAHILYLALHLESGSFPRPLTPAEERAAFAAMAAGDADARDRLIRHNLRLVAHIAKKYYSSGADQDDLVSMGTIGLIKAVNTFDPARLSRFSTYASKCVENELRMSFRKQRRQPPAVSLQEPIETGHGGGANLTVVDVLPDEAVMEEDVEQRDRSRRLHIMLAGLPARDRAVLTLRYGLGGTPPLTQAQVAHRLGLSRSYISRLEKRALETLEQAFSRPGQEK